MKERILKKRTMKMIRWMSGYTDVPVQEVKKECYKDVEDLIRQNNIFGLDFYTDCKTIDLMIDYKCGWFYEEVYTK